MNRYQELLDLVKSFEKDFHKFYDRGNKAAGVRLRKQMQDLRTFARSVRDEVQILNRELEVTETAVKLGKPRITQKKQ